MPGFIGGSSAGGSGGVGGEILFPKEFIDPVTKLRVSQPSNLIDTDFEYGLQPTKWETVELINNTPSFFSKSGDTTIPDILAITTNAGTREITVRTGNEHGLAIGIPINVTGTRSVTADGAYIIASIPNETTFTYLCKDIQPTTASIEDLYSSIITGEFFQGSQIRLADSEGITTDGEAVSLLTVRTPSPHGFGVNTPFYFLNLNSTVAQEFASANTETKSFDASNSATAQTFDGSNTLSSINIDWSNSATVAGVTSSISSVDATSDRITVSHGTENFVGKPIGTPLYYNVVAASGYFANNPRGVVFLKELISSSTTSSVFTVSQIPDGDVIDLTSSMTGTFQLANQARTFAGNNINLLTEVVVDVIQGSEQVFDATNTTGLVGTQTAYSGSNVTVTSETDLQWYQGTMVLYSTTGSAATGLTNNTTYFVDSYFRQGTSNLYSFTLKPLPDGEVITSISGGTGTQTFTQIFVSLDKDVFHVKDNGFEVNDMLEYQYPSGARFTTASLDEQVDFYFITTRYDQHNFKISQTTGDLTPKTISRIGTDRGVAIEPTTVTPVGLQAPITYAVTSGTLPAGLTLNTSTGVVSGTPFEAIAEPGRAVTITATDALGVEAQQFHTYQFNATVGSISPETISRVGILAQTEMTPTTATTSNLVAPITWSVSSGTLPTGLTLNTSTGVVSGTPTEEIASPGRVVVIKATDAGSLEAFQTHTYQIDAPPQLYAFTSATFTNGGASSRTGPTLAQARSGVGNPSWASTYLNMTTQGIQVWTVPATATYRIRAAGGQGGTGSSNATGGFGAILEVDVSLTQGQVLNLVVGHRGDNAVQGGGRGGGGGGGTFVYSGGIGGNGLIIAAGGGGGGDDGSPPGSNARSSLNPTQGYETSPPTETANDGQGGQGGQGNGAGWLSDGQVAGNNLQGTRWIGGDRVDGNAGFGGFGGGGGDGDDGAAGAGFSGGDSTGGAGGSYYAGLSVTGGYTSTWASSTTYRGWQGNNSGFGSIQVTKL